MPITVTDAAWMASIRRTWPIEAPSARIVLYSLRRWAMSVNTKMSSAPPAKA